MEKLTNDEPCPIKSALAEPPPEIAATLSVIGGKWKILILWQLLRRPCRFGELRRAIKGVSQHMLTVHLRELEQEGILTRTVFAEVPPRVEYALSPHGATLNGVMRTLGEWGALHASSKKVNLGGEQDRAVPDHTAIHAGARKITLSGGHSPVDEAGAAPPLTLP